MRRRFAHAIMASLPASRGSSGSRLTAENNSCMDVPYIVHRRRPVALRPKIIEVRFYATIGGAEPVRDWLKEMDQVDRRAIGADIATVEHGWPIGMPTCRPMGGGLWDVRTNLNRGRIARVIFTIVDG